MAREQLIVFDRKEYHKQYYKDNLEEIKAYKKQWAKDHPESEKLKERRIQWREEHREDRREYSRKYYKTEKGKATAQRSYSKRRSVIKEFINTLTAEEWEDILETHNYVCTYCGTEFNCELLPTKDHIIPISKGGDNVKENIIPACRSCNSKKYNKLIKI